MKQNTTKLKNRNNTTGCLEIGWERGRGMGTVVIE